MAYSRVASSGVLSTTSGGALTWTHSPTAGNLLTFRATSYNAEIAATAVTSIGGAGTFARDIGIEAPVSGGEWAQIFSLVAPAGVTSVKSAAGPTYQEGVFDEWSGNAATSVLDTTASNSGSAASGNAGTLSTGSNAGLVLAALNCDCATTSAPTATGSGWTGDANTGDSAPNALSSGFAYKVISGAGSQQMTWTFGSSPYGAVSASYKAASTSTPATATVSGQTVTCSAGSVTAVGTSSAAVQAYDSFAGSVGTALTAHTAPGGQTWTMHPAIGNIALSASPPQLDGSGGVVGEADGSNVALFGATPASADYEAQAVWTPSGGVGSYHNAVWVRADSAADTGYLVWVVADSASTYHLEAHARVDGADTSLGGTAAGAISAPSGTAVYLKLTASGTTISAAWAYASDVATTGWRVASWTDGSVTAAGRVGFQLRSGDPATFRDFRLQDVGTAYDASLPAASPAMAVSPVSVDASTTGDTLTVTGTSTAWTTSTTFSVSAGSITATSVDAGTQVATLTYDAPATAQTVILTDSDDAASATFDVAASTLALTIGAFNLTATRFGIGVELLVSGDSANVASAVVQFKKTADPTFRYALGCEGGKPVKTYITADNDGVGKGFYHAILQCSPDTEYTIQVTVACSNGVVGTNPVVGTITTVAENTFTPEGVRTPDYFVDPIAGNDSHVGTSWATAYATIGAGIAALNASGSTAPVLGIGPGYPMASQVPITKAGATIIAVTSDGTANPATVATNTSYSGVPYPEPSANPANAGNRTVVHAGVYTSPTTSGDLHAGPWTQQTFTGPVDGLTHTVWKWTAVDVTGAAFTYAGVLGYASTKAVEPERVASWNQSSLVVNGYSTNTAAGWAEMVQTNPMHQSGWYVDPDDHQTIYASLPGGDNPNDFYVWIGSQNNSSSNTNAGFTIHADGVTICGPEMRALQYGVLTSHAATDFLVDHVLFGLTQYHVYCTVAGTTYGTPTSYAHDGLVQSCLHHDTNLWAADGGTRHRTIPWHLCKDYVILADGSNYGVAVADLCQSISVRADGCRRLTWRYNTQDGLHNSPAVGGEMQSSPSGVGCDRYQAQDLELLYNVVRHSQDDGFEPVSSCLNGRATFNRLAYTLTAYSPNSLNYGPFFYCRNQVWMTGADGEAPGGGTNDALPGTTMIKWGAVTPVDAWSYLAHNTFWTNSDVTRDATHELVEAMGDFSGNGHHNRFWLRNNVVRSTATRIFQAPQNAVIGATPSNDYWDEDYNQFGSANADTTDPNGVALDFGTDSTPVHDYGTIAAYRTGQGQGAHSNPVGTGLADVATLDAQFADAATGDLRLAADSGLIGAGTPLGNLSDVLVADGGSLVNGGYYGSAPDLGAVEHASASVDATATVTGQTLTAGVAALTATGTAAVAVTGQGATTSLAGVAAVGAASATATDQTATLTSGGIGATGAATVTTSGQSSTLTVGTVPASGNATAAAAGQTTTASIGTTTAAGAATATTPALTASALAGTVTATAGGSATAVVTGDTIAASTGAMSASGAASVPIGALTAVITVGAATAQGGASVTPSPSTVTLSISPITASGGVLATPTPATLTVTAGPVTTVTGGSAVANVAPLALAATIAAVTVQAEATATVAGVTLETTAGDVLAATQIVAFVAATTLTVASVAATASGAATAALAGALLTLAAQGVTASNGLSGDIYVGGAVRANILGGAVRAPGPVPLQPGTLYGDGTYGDGLYGPQRLAAGGSVRANIVGGKVKGR